ncbi:MAG: HAD family hydrolase [Nevskia sp.]|nr:HAD family hydrolase [Nevskia sp.]
MSPTQKRTFRAWALLDRDGTIIVDKIYLSDPNGIEFASGALNGMRLLRDAGFGLVLVTNQSGIARGYFDNAALATVHARLVELLASEGLTLEAIKHCPHGPNDGCDCRKPAPGMIRAAMEDLGFDPTRAVMIGDSDADMGAATAGIPGIRIDLNGGSDVATDFLQAARRAAALFS